MRTSGQKRGRFTNLDEAFRGSDLSGDEPWAITVQRHL